MSARFYQEELDLQGLMSCCSAHVLGDTNEERETAGSSLRSE